MFSPLSQDDGGAGPSSPPNAYAAANSEFDSLNASNAAMRLSGFASNDGGIGGGEQVGAMAESTVSLPFAQNQNSAPAQIGVGGSGTPASAPSPAGGGMANSLFDRIRQAQQQNVQQPAISLEDAGMASQQSTQYFSAAVGDPEVGTAAPVMGDSGYDTGTLYSSAPRVPQYSRLPPQESHAPYDVGETTGEKALSALSSAWDVTVKLSGQAARAGGKLVDKARNGGTGGAGGTDSLLAGGQGGLNINHDMMQSVPESHFGSRFEGGGRVRHRELHIGPFLSPARAGVGFRDGRCIGSGWRKGYGVHPVLFGRGRGS